MSNSLTVSPNEGFLHVLLCCLPHQRWKQTEADITFGGQAASEGKYQTREMSMTKLAGMDREWLTQEDTKGTDTLIQDGSNMCWTSGPAGMSDGVMTSRKSSGHLIRC